MQMGWSPAVAPQLLEQLAHGPVMGDGVADRLDALEPEDALVVAEHDAALAGPLLVSARVLHVIMAAAVCLPDVDLDVFHRLARNVFHGTNTEQWLALWVRRHLAAVGQGRRVVRVEGAQNRALGRRGRLGVVDAVDEEGEAENI